MRAELNAHSELLGWLHTASPGARSTAQLEVPAWWSLGGAPPLRFDVHLERTADRTLARFVSSTQQDVTLDLTQPWPLEPVRIAKPWGEEWWFTGIEARGVSGVGSADAALPLPVALALAPQWLCGELAGPPILLKILAPHPDAFFGELYLEVHARKREVYVVTHVDRSAWPDGRGGVRFGLREPDGDQSVATGLRASLHELRTSRDAIDAAEDAARAQLGIAPNDVLALEQARALFERTPADLRAAHQRAKRDVDRYLHLQRIAVGDSIVVPRGVAHALQGGVRVVEFQTPDYERYVLAFNQKVLTQAGWDIDDGIAALQSPASPATERLPMSKSELPARDGVALARLVDFPEFEVLRVTLATSRDACWQPPLGDYAIAIGITGQAQIGDYRLDAERACFVPTPALAHAVRAVSDAPATLLWAAPRNHAAS